MTGTTARYSSGKFTGITSKEARPSIDAALPRVSACHAATEFDPPLHDEPQFMITIAPTGNVTSVQRVATSSQPVHPKYDACVRGVLASSVYPAKEKGATVTVGFSAPVPR